MAGVRCRSTVLTSSTRVKTPVIDRQTVCIRPFVLPGKEGEGEPVGTASHLLCKRLRVKVEPVRFGSRAD